MDKFFTPHMNTVSNLLWAITSAVGAGVCFFVLLIIGAVWIHPKSRPFLDRVSFRLVTVALFTNMIFGISSAVAGTRTGPGAVCGFSIFILQLTLQFSSALLFSIALNLQFVVVHGFNGQNLEKLYFIVSIVLSCIIVIPPYAAGQYGWDVTELVCWYTNDDQGQRLAWQIATQMAWTALMALGEIVSSLTVMMFMLKHTIRRRRIILSMNSMSGDAVLTAPQKINANSYKQIIMRIALYPLASCVVNLLSIFSALHSTISKGINNTTDYNILLLSDFLYGGRAIVYALLAASDPALVRGVKALYHATRGFPLDSSVQKSHATDLNPSPSNGLVVHIELETIIQPSAAATVFDSVANDSTKLPLGDGNFSNKGSISTVESGVVTNGALNSQQQEDLSTADDQREQNLRLEQDAFKRQL